MSIWGALAGGFVGTLVLTTALRTANELGLTRVDLPFLLGTAFTGDRARAKALGYLLHLLAGQMFALIYYALFAAIDDSGWLLGAAFGLLHGVVSATALVNVLLPVVHPRMGSTLSAAESDSANTSRERAGHPTAPRSRRSRPGAGQARTASRASRSAAASSVSVRFGKANRSFERPSSGREKNDDPGTAAIPGSRMIRNANATSSSPGSARSPMSVIT